MDTSYGMNEAILEKEGIIKLLKIKDSYIRMMILKQADKAVDRGVHIGGALSSVIPLVSLFYGGIINIDIGNPTRPGQDMFVLSKGHAVASMAAIYADIGYFDRSVLVNSRSVKSILNGHPGPILPGVHVSTGPLGQGIGVAQGFALRGKGSPAHDAYCMVGDGELQEGIVWEALMYSAAKKLDNLCVLVDCNQGQLDDPYKLVIPMGDLASKFEAFGWKVYDTDSTEYWPVLDALYDFKYGGRDGRPTAVLCNSTKGFGGFSEFMKKHKVEISADMYAQELEQHVARLDSRTAEFAGYFEALEATEIKELVAAFSKGINIELEIKESKIAAVRNHEGTVKTKPAPARDKRIAYAEEELPVLDRSKQYDSSGVIEKVMRVFARDRRIVSIDSDLASTSGLEAGVSFVDSGRALNVGIAEANMLDIGEAYAALGCNVWVSTFCPFFDWKVLRRIAVGYQERLEAMESGLWLSEGHGLDMTFVATAPNLETKTNGATHMGNDDITVFSGIAHLKIIDVSCPQQLIGIMKWIAEGNRGLVYLRIMRSSSNVLYAPDDSFEYGKGHMLRQSGLDGFVIISSGRGVHEALTASDRLRESGIYAGVADMPSIDEKLLLELYHSGRTLIFAEQNNGYIWSQFKSLIFEKGLGGGERFVAVNALDAEGKPQFIHSGTYGELTEKLGLGAVQLERLIAGLAGNSPEGELL